MSKLEKILAGLVMLLFVVSVILIFVQVQDGGWLLPDNPAIVATLLIAIVAITGIVAETVRSGNYANGYINLIDRLTSDVQLQDTIEKEYMAMPPGLQKDAIKTFSDIASAIVRLSPDKRDDILAKWLQDALDGKINTPE